MSEGSETPNLAEIESRCWVVAAHVASHRRDGSRCPNDLEMLNRATDDIADLLDQLSSLATRLEAAERESDGAALNQRNNDLVRVASQCRRRIAELETAATEYLDFAFGNQLPNDKPKSETLRLANRLYHTAWQDEDPGIEYGVGGSIDPAPDAVSPDEEDA